MTTVLDRFRLDDKVAPRFGAARRRQADPDGRPAAPLQHRRQQGPSPRLSEHPLTRLATRGSALTLLVSTYAATKPASGWHANPNMKTGLGPRVAWHLHVAICAMG
jgi:hypothetical protein